MKRSVKRISWRSVYVKVGAKYDHEIIIMSVAI